MSGEGGGTYLDYTSHGSALGQVITRVRERWVIGNRAGEKRLDDDNVRKTRLKRG